MPDLSVAVIVPSYRRPEALARCLRALSRQTVAPARVVVAVRHSDEGTRRCVERLRTGLANLEIADVSGPGVIRAIDAALGRCSEAVIAQTDDDAVPHRDWIERMLRHYAADVGGVGGRDLVWDGTTQPGSNRGWGAQREVGRIAWFGRVAGNHHLGPGLARQVHVLKGVNISLRRELWVLDRELKGSGAQVAWELGMCLRARADGWRLIYDPAILVDHFPAERFDEDCRGRPTLRAQTDAEWNQCFVIARHAPARLAGQAAIYQLAVGSHAAPGLLRPALSIQAVRSTVADPRRYLVTAAARMCALAAGFSLRVAARALSDDRGGAVRLCRRLDPVIGCSRWRRASRTVRTDACNHPVATGGSNPADVSRERWSV